jgi:hypothetical protein
VTAEAASLVRLVRDVVVPALAQITARDLGVPAGSLQRTCRETLEHMAELPHGWACRVATRSHANDYVTSLELGSDTPSELLGTLDAGLAVFADVLRVMADGELAAHSAGPADSLGWAAMIADEQLVHLWDIGQGLGTRWTLPGDVCEAVLRRLFPWAGDDGLPEERLLWVNGRAELHGKPPIRDWVWHYADPSRWDGQILSDQTLTFLPMERRRISAE